MNIWELIMEDNEPHLLVHHIFVQITFGSGIYMLLTGISEEMCIIIDLCVHACGYAAIPCFVFAFRSHIPSSIHKFLNFPIALAKLACAVFIGALFRYLIFYWQHSWIDYLWSVVSIVLIIVEFGLFVQKCKRSIRDFGL